MDFLYGPEEQMNPYQKLIHYSVKMESAIQEVIIDHDKSMAAIRYSDIPSYNSPAPFSAIQQNPFMQISGVPMHQPAPYNNDTEINRLKARVKELEDELAKYKKAAE